MTLTDFLGSRMRVRVLTGSLGALRHSIPRWSVASRLCPISVIRHLVAPPTRVMRPDIAALEERIGQTTVFVGFLSDRGGRAFRPRVEVIQTVRSELTGDTRSHSHKAPTQNDQLRARGISNGFWTHAVTHPTVAAKICAFIPSLNHSVKASAILWSG